MLFPNRSEVTGEATGVTLTGARVREIRDSSSLGHFVKNVEETLERFAPGLAVCTLLMFVCWAWFASRAQLLQFDELLELWPAYANTNRQLLLLLSSGVDFNPPLSHFVIRAFTATFGQTDFLARLPAILGVVVFLACLYWIVSEQVSRSYGVVAILLILCTPVKEYAVQARPYGLVLAFSGLSMLLYILVTQGRYRLPALLGVAVCTAALVASHYYAILVTATVLVAELARVWRSKRPDWMLLACLTLPSTIILFLLRGSIAQQKRQLTHYFAKGSILSFDHGFDLFSVDPLACCLAIVLIVGAISVGWTKYSPPSTPDRGSKHQNVVLSIGLLLLPVLGAVVSQLVTHAYVARYFLPAALGFALCFCYTARIVSRVIPALAVLLTLSLGVGFSKAIVQESQHPQDHLPPLAVLTSALTPVLFDTPANYAQIYYYYPSVRKNIWVIVDPAASLRYRNYDTDDKIMRALADHGDAQAISLSAAVRKWPTFRLVPRSADNVWALHCLMESQAQIAVKQAFGTANFLFEITPRQATITQVAACSLPKL